MRDAIAAALQLPPDLVADCLFLTEGDLYEFEASGSRHLRCDAAQQIDKALQEARRQGLRQAKSLQAVIADVGGLPEVKAVLTESARYRFDNVRFLRPLEQHDDRPAPVQVEHRVPPAESLHTRRHVATLLRAGAWDAAARLARSGVPDSYLSSEPWRAWRSRWPPRSAARRPTSTRFRAACVPLWAALSIAGRSWWSPSASRRRSRRGAWVRGPAGAFYLFRRLPGRTCQSVFQPKPGDAVHQSSLRVVEMPRCRPRAANGALRRVGRERIGCCGRCGSAVAPREASRPPPPRRGALRRGDLAGA